jgi:DNA-binding NarL/FixJ family response regulator
MRIVIADDHPLYREAVRVRLRCLYPDAAIFEAASLQELLALAPVDRSRFNLVLMDLRMPGIDNAAAAIEHVLERFPSSPIAVMSGAADHDDVRQVMHAGAQGFLPKTMPSEPFATALSLLIAGGTYLPAEILERAADEPSDQVSRPVSPPALDDRLTPREKQVLVRLAGGASNKEIARDLGLSEVTIKLHVRQIFKKIGARNRSEAAAMAARAKLM